jgi:hypothetical protein
LRLTAPETPPEPLSTRQHRILVGAMQAGETQNGGKTAAAEKAAATRKRRGTQVANPLSIFG